MLSVPRSCGPVFYEAVPFAEAAPKGLHMFRSEEIGSDGRVLKARRVALKDQLKKWRT